MGSGVAVLSIATLMLEFLALMPLRLMFLLFQLPSNGMKKSSVGLMGRKYGRLDMSSFTPIVLAATGGLAQEAGCHFLQAPCGFG